MSLITVNFSYYNTVYVLPKQIVLKILQRLDGKYDMHAGIMELYVVKELGLVTELVTESVTEKFVGSRLWNVDVIRLCACAHAFIREQTDIYSRGITYYMIEMCVKK